MTPVRLVWVVIPVPLLCVIKQVRAVAAPVARPWELLAGTVPGVLVLALLLGAACSDVSSSPTPSPQPSSAPADQGPISSASVVRVLDGTTIEVEIEGKVYLVRYLGIEALADGASDGGTQSLEERARRFNAARVAGRQVELETDGVDTDPSGRLLRYVYVDGEMVNMALVTNGFATVSTFPADFKHRHSFAIEEERAKQGRAGFWEAAVKDQDKDPPAAPAQPFFGGTLPLLPPRQGRDVSCDYSDTAEAVIKGNIEARSGDRVYYVPGTFFYSTTVVSHDEGDRLFCTEEEARAAGWKRSKH